MLKGLPQDAATWREEALALANAGAKTQVPVSRVWAMFFSPQPKPSTGGIADWFRRQVG